jgi:hypothetical protein
MSRPTPGALAVALTALGIVAGGAFAAPADMPYQGTWKVTVTAMVKETSAWLIRFDKGGKSPAKLVAALPQFRETTLEQVQAGPKGLRMTLKRRDARYEISAYPVKGKTPTLLGSLLWREASGQQYLPVRLEKTDQKELDPKAAERDTEGVAELKKLATVFDPEARDRGYKALVAKYAGKPMAYWASGLLLDSKLRQRAGPGALKEAAEAHVKAAGVYGREMEVVALTGAGEAFLRGDKTAKLALEFARKAAGLLAESDPADRQITVLKLLAAALRKAGGKEAGKELKGLDARIGRVEERLDQEARAEGVPFQVKEFAGRKGKGGHVVVVELFTGAQSPQSVAADIAFDAALRRYGPADAVLLRYHLHVPASDPLASPAGEARRAYYDLDGIPAVFVDGKVVPELGGAARFGRDRFDKLCAAVEKALGGEAGARLRLKVGRDGDRVSVQAQVEGLKSPGEKVRLRLALVEEEVRYIGFNRRRLHYHVVRDMPGGAEGFELRRKAATVLVGVSLADVRKRLEEHLRARAKEQPFATDERPLGLKRLKVIAFVQDDATRRVLQSAQADVPGGK